MSGQEDAFPAGGDLSDMAATGTSIPEDSAKPRIIPSVAKPSQVADTASDPNDLGARDLASAADNASDMPRVSSYTFSTKLRGQPSVGSRTRGEAEMFYLGCSRHGARS